MQRSQNGYSRRNFFLFFIGWWLAWSLIQAIVLHRLGLDWIIALGDSFVSNILLGVLSLMSITLYRFYQPGKGNRAFRFVYALGSSIVFCVIFKWLMLQLYPLEHTYHHLIEKTMPLRFVVALMILSFITLLNWMWNILEEQKERELRHNEAKDLVKEAELVKLRQQLQPHFLFNSLNSISALAGTRPEEARKMIQQLSDFLRGTLKKDEQQQVTLKEELAHLQLYLEIEKLRFGHRLSVELKTDDPALASRIPPLLLQPLVENAIKFGLYGTVNALVVTLRAVMENGALVITIKNPFDDETQNNREGTGFGLNSIQRRLFLIYGRNDLLKTEKAENTFTTILKIPQ